MASKPPDSGSAQVLMTCHLCSNQVELYCNSCGINLCGDCVGQHLLSLSYQKHDVVKYSSKYDIFQPFCTEHHDLKCEIYCEECESPVCSKCVASKSHKNHNFKELQEKYTILKETIAKDTETLESLIVKEYQNIVVELQEIITDLSNYYSNLRSSVSQRGEELHQLIDSVIRKFHSDIDDMERLEIEKAEQNLSEFQRLLDTVQNTIKENYKYLQSMEKGIFAYKSMLNEFREVPSRLTLTAPPMFIPAKTDMNIPNKFVKYIGKIIPSRIIFNDSYKLTQTSSSNKEVLRKPHVIATIEIPKYVFKNLYRVCCVGKEEAWVNGSSKSMIRCDKQGSILEVVDTHSGDIPVGLTVTRKGELMFTDRKAKSINIVRNGITEVLCKPEWLPGTICSTDDGDFLVAMWNGLSGNKKEIKVTRYCETEVKQDIQYDENGQPIFEIKGEYTGLAVAENRNGDICVADWNSNAVVVINRSGKLRFKYSGEGEGMFIPRYTTTDSQAHILISEIKNQSVHVLDIDGNAVLIIDNCGFSHPYGASVDNEDKLWLLERFGKIKIIKYLK